MDFDQAVAAHQKWKTRLRMLVNGHGENDLSPALVGSDRECELGRWLHSNQAPGGATCEELKAVHAKFHQTASEVVRLAQAGKPSEADALLEGPYFQVSSQVVQAILKCKKGG